MRNLSQHLEEHVPWFDGCSFSNAICWWCYSTETQAVMGFISLSLLHPNLMIHKNNSSRRGFQHLSPCHVKNDINAKLLSSAKHCSSTLHDSIQFFLIAALWARFYDLPQLTVEDTDRKEVTWMAVVMVLVSSKSRNQIQTAWLQSPQPWVLTTVLSRFLNFVSKELPSP